MRECLLQKISRAKSRTVRLKLIYEDYGEKTNALHTKTGFSRNFTTALGNIKGFYTDFPYVNNTYRAEKKR